MTSQAWQRIALVLTNMFGPHGMIGSPQVWHCCQQQQHTHLRAVTCTATGINTLALFDQTFGGIECDKTLSLCQNPPLHFHIRCGLLTWTQIACKDASDASQESWVCGDHNGCVAVTMPYLQLSTMQAAYGPFRGGSCGRR